MRTWYLAVSVAVLVVLAKRSSDRDDEFLRTLHDFLSSAFTSPASPPSPDS